MKETTITIKFVFKKDSESVKEGLRGMADHIIDVFFETSGCGADLNLKETEEIE